MQKRRVVEMTAEVVARCGMQGSWELLVKATGAEGAFLYSPETVWWDATWCEGNAGRLRFTMRHKRPPVQTQAPTCVEIVVAAGATGQVLAREWLPLGLRHFCGELLPRSTAPAPSLNILLFGPPLCGKSSFVDAAFSLLRPEEVVGVAPRGGDGAGVTAALTGYRLLSESEERSQLVLWDCWSVEADAKMQLEALLRGLYKKGDHRRLLREASLRSVSQVSGGKPLAAQFQVVLLFVNAAKQAQSAADVAQDLLLMIRQCQKAGSSALVVLSKFDGSATSLAFKNVLDLRIGMASYAMPVAVATEQDRKTSQDRAAFELLHTCVDLGQSGAIRANVKEMLGAVHQPARP